MPRDLLRDALVRDEGKKLTAYQDTNGFWTIGVGHLLGTERRMLSITEAECDALLEVDIKEAIDAVLSVFSFNLLKSSGVLQGIDTTARWRALVNMAFNRGEKRMRESTTITPAIKDALAADVDHDIAWKKVAEAIRKSPWAAQIGARAERLAKQFETNIDQ